MDIPFMRTDRQFIDHRDEFMAAVESVFSHGQVLQGPEVKEFETRVADLHDSPYAVAVGSATDALYLSLRAVGIRDGDRVAVTAFTFVASAAAIVRAGGVPVFVDIGNDYQADTGRILDLVNAGDVAGVMVVHMFGQMADISEVYRSARASGAFVVEDAAQCLGSDLAGIKPGVWSDAACLSFDPTKIIGAFGSGGAVITHDAEIADTVIRLRYHGKDQSGLYRDIGLNSQMASVQAALLNVKLGYLDEWIAGRRAIAQRYSAVLDELPGVSPPDIAPGSSHAFHKYVLRTGARRDAGLEHLGARGIGTAVHYQVPLHRQPLFAGVSDHGGSLHGAEEAAGQVLSLPIYPEMTDEEVEHVCDALRAFVWDSEIG